MDEGRMDVRRAMEVFKRMAEETERLARALYGDRWEDMVEKLEDRYDGDPWAVLEHLRREAARRGIKA